MEVIATRGHAVIERFKSFLPINAENVAWWGVVLSMIFYSNYSYINVIIIILTERLIHTH